MITKNEEEFLSKSLTSVKELVCEIIIVDTGSTDRTIEIAESFGARIFQHAWEDDFSKHRNQSISYATGEWILVMDADEVIATRDLDRIKGVLDTVHADGFFFTLRNYESTFNLANLILNPGDYEEGAGFPGFIGCDLIRLFKNDPLIFFTGQVHETVAQAIVQSKKITFNTGIPIHHYGKVRGDRIKRKQDSYLALGMKRLDENPHDPMAYKGLSDQLLELGSPQEALEIADRGLAVFPEMLELRFNRGLSLDRLGSEEEAEQEYLWVITRQPDHLGACHNLGQIYFRRNQFEKVVRLLNPAIEKGLKHPAVFTLLGRAFGATGDASKALENFERVRNLQPDYPEVNCHIAVIFLNNHQYNDALKALEREIENGGNLVAAYNLLGEMSLYWKDMESARNFFLKVLAIDPDNKIADAHIKAIQESPYQPNATGVMPIPSDLFTGERAMPLASNMDDSIMCEHWARYRRVASMTRGLTFDIACGSGYGSDYLAATGARKGVKVIGGDLSKESIAYCRAHYARPNMHFMVTDILDLPFLPASVDTLVSFETLEHVVEGERFLREVVRVLRVDGTLIVSSPLGGPVGNPFHHAFYQQGTFSSYLKQFFEDVSLSFQRGEQFFTDSHSPGYAPTFTGEYAFAVCRRPKRIETGLTSIIILTHNQWDQTRECLESIKRHTPEPHEIIIVDNGSTDETRTRLKSCIGTQSNLRVVINHNNRGFATGNNQGLTLARGEYVLLLNNDTVVTPGWLKGMQAVLQHNPQIGIVGPMSNYVSGPQLVPDTSYRNLSELDRYAMQWAAEHTMQIASVSRIVGFCLLAHRSVFNRIGGLDERYGSGNFEDDDLCIRAALVGYKGCIAQDVFIHHTGSQTFKGANIDYRQSILHNWNLFKTKWGIPADIPIEKGYCITIKATDSSIFYVPLPDLSLDHRPKIDLHWWEETSTTG